MDPRLREDDKYFAVMVNNSPLSFSAHLCFYRDNMPS
jgi:hypothetical protein